MFSTTLPVFNIEPSSPRHLKMHTKTNNQKLSSKYKANVTALLHMADVAPHLADVILPLTRTRPELR